MSFKLIFGLVLAGILVLLIIQNVTIVELKFLFWTLSMSWAFLIFLILSAGIILGWLLCGSIRSIKTTPMQSKAL
jgi:uncharacterized integral membrane protein